MTKIILMTRDEMISDLLGGWKNPYKMNNEELEIYYNNEFYGGFNGITYKIKRG